MPSFYRFNIVRDQIFYMCSDEGFMNQSSAEVRLSDLRKRFPASEGFEVTLTYWKCEGKTINL